MANYKQLSDVLDIEHDNTIDADVAANGLVTISSTNNAVVPSNREADEEEDYQKSREIYTKVAQFGLDNLERVSDVAELTNEPRAFEVVALIMKSLNETAKQLNDIHTERKAAKNVQQGNNVSVEKAVFVGSPDELLKAVKNKNVNQE